MSRTFLPRRLALVYFFRSSISLLGRVAALSNPMFPGRWRTALPLCAALSRRFVWRCAAALFAVALSVVPLRAYAKDQVPDWVRTAAAQALPAYPPRTDAVVLLEDDSYTIAPDGVKVEHVRRVVKILRPQGRRFGEMSAWFSGSEKLHYLHLWSIGADGHEYAVRDSDLTEGSSWGGFALYSDDRARGGAAPAIDTGAVAAMEYEKQERPYENEIIWVPDETIPVVKERLTLSLPPGFAYKAGWKGNHTSSPVDLEKGRTMWEVSGLPALSMEDTAMAPGESSLASRLDVFYYGPVASPYPVLRGEWKDVGEWYEALAHDRNVPDAAITAKAKELVAGKTDFRDRVEAIADFVQQQIRYVAIEIGIGGHQPHPASDIFRTQYGDCKDKATLLSAMLQAVGIHSTWVMVDTERGVVAKDAPSIMGNHMIGAIELPADYTPRQMYSVVTLKGGKRFLLFDPTWEKTPFGQIERELQGSDALLVDGANSQAIRIPVLQPEQNLIERRSSFTLNADGNLTGSVHESRAGDIARERRTVFTERDAKQQQNFLDHVLAGDLLNFKISDVQTSNVRDLSKDMHIDYALQADHFAQEAGPLLMIRPRVFGRESFPLDRRSGQGHREVAIDLGSTRKVHDDCEITLPAGYAVDELPKAMDVDLGFASYRSKVSATGNTLHYERTFTVREITLPANRYADVEKLSRLITTDEQNQAILKRTN